MADLNTARQKLAHDLGAALTAALTSTNVVKPVVLVSAPGGLGKSHQTVHQLRHLRVVWFSPTNGAMAQVEGFLDAPLAGVPPLPGPGPARPTVEKRIARKDAGACLDPPRLDNVERQGLGRYMDREACRPCPLRSSCPYKTWKPSSEWLFATHVRLALDTGDKHLFANRDIVVIDESPLLTMLGGVSLSDAEVREALTVLKAQKSAAKIPVARTAFIALFEQIQELLDHPPEGRRRIELRELAKDLGYEFVNRIASLVNPVHGMGQLKQRNLATVDPSSVAELVRAFAGPPWLREKLVELADALAQDDRKRPTCVVVLPQGTVKGGIAAGHFRELPVPLNLPLVVLDATADDILYWLALGRDILKVDVDVDQVAVIYQTPDRRYPAWTLTDPSGAAIPRLMTIVDRYKQQNPTHRVGLIIKKGVYEKKHVQVRVDSTFAASDILFFWGMRGSNQMKDYDAVFVVGAPELAYLEIEARVRAFMSRVPLSRTTSPSDYQVQTKDIESVGLWRLVDQHGREVSLEERFIDGLEGYVLRVFHEQEFIQAILRGRPYDPSKKKAIYFFSKLFLTAFDVTYVREAELLGKDLAVRAMYFLANVSPPYPNQRQLALALGVSESALSKAKEKDPEFWRRRVAPRLA